MKNTGIYLCTCAMMESTVLSVAHAFTTCCSQNERTALMLAIYMGHTSVAEELISRGAEVNAKDEVNVKWGDKKEESSVVVECVV